MVLFFSKRTQFLLKGMFMSELVKALHYHQYPRPGKLEISPIKTLNNQHDLSLAYSPGVAWPCKEIMRDPSQALHFTARGNLVGVISNGTAVLGLGNIGALASKPVMEGKAVLFKKFAGIDAFDIEINETDPKRLIEIVASLEPTFGGINLEDIKAPDCFEVEEGLKKKLSIPVFHDDQYGTAITVTAALLNGLLVAGKNLNAVRLVVSGAGAGALACLDLLESFGLLPDQVWLFDSKGLVHHSREGVSEKKRRYAQPKPCSLPQAMEGADVFLGLSIGEILAPSMVEKMAPHCPIIFALANPVPEIWPHVAQEVRPDSIVATGRSDYPNQVNNVLCFPYIFRGTLDSGATIINEEMKKACVKALCGLAHEPVLESARKAYGEKELSFGPHYLIPNPFDKRLLTTLAPAVAQAAYETGVATRGSFHRHHYEDSLKALVGP